MCKSIWSSLKEIKIKSWKVIGGSVVKNLPANAGETQETQSQSLDQEDPLEEGMAIHSNILAWRIPRTEELGMPQSIGLQRVRHNWSNWAYTECIYFNPLSLLLLFTNCILLRRSLHATPELLTGREQDSFILTQLHTVLSSEHGLFSVILTANIGAISACQ